MQVNGNGVIGRDGRATIDLQAANLAMDWARNYTTEYFETEIKQLLEA